MERSTPKRSRRSMTELSLLHEQVIPVVKSAGAYIREQFQSFSSQHIEVKGLHDLVSYVDKEAEDRLVAELAPLLPASGFITEEDESRTRAAEYNWIIDPLDGTTNFIHKVPTFSVSVALARGEEVVLGVVYEINRDECFSAYKDGGAYLNGLPIRVSATAVLADSLLATGFPFRKFDQMDEYLLVLKSLMQQTRGIRRIGSAAVDLAYAACGRFDCFFEFNLNNYDMAAGILLVKEAGGWVGDFSGGDQMLTKGNVIAGNQAIAAEIFAEIKKHFSRVV